MLCHQADGNVVLYHDGLVVWFTNTAGASTTVLTMQSDGNLVLYGPGSTVVWASNTGGQAPASYWLAIQDDCNLVIYLSATPYAATFTSCP
jgi:hypothetical protein